MRSNPETHPKALKQSLALMASIVGITTLLSFGAPDAPRLAAQTSEAQAHFTFPDTPAAKQLQAWLAAFNSGDRATLRAFVEKVMPQDAPPNFVEETIEMRKQFGGIDFQKSDT